MNIVPSWAPNIHPMLVHFPIVILLLAVFFDILSVLFRSKSSLRTVALFFYGIGILILWGVYFSGREAVESLKVADSVYPAISDHANWAGRTAWFWSALVVLRFFFLFRKWDRTVIVAILVILLGIVGNGLVFKTAEYGAALVYRLGVGVQTTSGSSASTQSTSPAEKKSSNLFQKSNGTVEWKIGEDAPAILKNYWRQFAGDPSRVQIELQKDEGSNPLLSFSLNQSHVGFLYPQKFSNIAFTAVLNKDAFQGSLFLVHHFQDSLNYDFLQLKNGKMKLGRLVQGKMKVMDVETVPAQNWITVKIVGSKGHYRGYLNGEMKVHGHGKDLPPGKLGWIWEGTGKVSLKKIVINPL